MSSKAAGSQVNRQKYNGKEQESGEFTDGSGLDTYNYGARVYDAQIGRWWQPDPLAEKYFSVSPYNYCLNNPISLFDYDGRDAIIIIDFEKKTITIQSTIYFKGGTKEQREEYINAADAYMKDNPKLFSGKFKDGDGNEWSMGIDINYQDLEDKNPKEEAKKGNNLLDITKLDDMVNSSATIDKGRKDDDGNLMTNPAGVQANLRGDSKNSKGRTSVHETFHMLGLSDRYTDSYSNGKRVSTSHRGFERDIMAGGNQMHQTHWNNWGNYALSQPQVQQQQTQSLTQFTLKYRIDITPDGKKITR